MRNPAASLRPETGPPERPGGPGSLLRKEVLLGTSLFLVALAARAIHLWEIRNLSKYLILDSLYYYRWAERILGGDWIGGEIFDQSPFYAYFLAALLYGMDLVRKLAGSLPLFQEPLLWVRASQAVLGALGCVLLVRVARRAGTETESHLAGFLAAVYGPFIFYDTMIMKTFLATLLSLSCILFLYRSGGVRRGSLTAAGALLGLTSLVRDNFILMVPFLLAGLLPSLPRPRFRTSLRAAGWLLAGTAIVLFPVTLRNRLVGGELALLTAGGGEVFYIGNNPEADGRYRPPCIPVAGKVQCVRADPEHEHDDFRRIAAALAGRDLSPMESSRFWFRKGIGFILDHPGSYLALLGRKLGIFLQDTEIGDNYDYEVFRRISRLLSLPIPTFGLVVSLAFLGILRSFTRWRRFSLLYAAAGGYTATVLLFFNFSRFRIPAVAVLIVFASVGAAWIGGQAARSFRAFLRGGFQPGIRAAALLVLGLVGVALPFRLAHRGGPTTILYTVQRQVHLGDLLRISHRPRKALREYEKATYLLGDAPIRERLDLLGDTSPETFQKVLQEEKLLQGVNFRIVHARLYEGMGLAHLDLKDPERAAELLEESLRIFVDGTDTLRRLVNAYREAGNLRGAADASERALKIQELFDLRFDLAGIYFDLGDLDKAYRTLAVAPRRNPNLTPGEMADYHFGLGLILLESSEHREEARRHLEACLRLAPDHPQAEEIRNNLRLLGAAPPPAP